MFEERVRRGAAWLDQVKPGWEQMIDIRQLNLRQFESCTIGQTFGSLTSQNLCVDRQFSIPMGFALDTPIAKFKRVLFWKRQISGYTQVQANHEYKLLTSAWIQEILRRQAASRMEKSIIEKVNTEA
jgi:hypothetical protein